DAEAEAHQQLGSVPSQHAETHDADPYVAGWRLVAIAPIPLGLLPVINSLLAVMDQNLEGDPFRHALVQGGIDTPNDRNIRQATLIDDMVNTGAERENRDE